MADFAVALVAEIASLEREIRHDVRYIRLRKLKKLLSLYEAGTAASNQTVNFGKSIKTESEDNGARRSHRQPSPDRKKALSVAGDYIKVANRITPTREVMEHLAANNIEIGGSNPLNNLSAMLSTSGLFQPHGRKGWTMKGTIEPISEKSDYEAMASEVFNDLTANELTRIEDYIESNAGLSQEIDRRLLRFARERNNNTYLTDEQKKTLRTFFRRLVENHL